MSREKNFLSYASHELRTPISTIQANIELINSYQDTLKKEILAPIQRIDRAAQTMKHLTETLLWLSRKNEQMLELQQLDLQELIQQTCQSLEYLLRGKTIELNIETEPYVVTAPGAAVHIVIANIIRNAFQYTYDGYINIVQHQGHIRVENGNLVNEHHQAELGFGLGLRLIQELTDTFEWQYQNCPQDNGHVVELTLPE